MPRKPAKPKTPKTKAKETSVGTFDFMAFVAAITKFSADLRSKAGIMVLIADAAAIFQLFAGGGTPDPAPPAVTAPMVGVPPPQLSSAAVADQLDAHVSELKTVGASSVVGKFGDGSLLAKFLPMILQGILAALTGA